MTREKWIALAEVIPLSEFSGLDRPAFVNVIGLAMDEKSFVELIRTECTSLDIQLVSVEDVEPWRVRLENSQPDNEVEAQADSVCDEMPFIFGTFFTFDE